MLLCGIAGAWVYAELMRVPTSRLSGEETYAEMPPDTRHHYVDLPLVYGEPERGSYRAFYILSPGFDPSTKPVVFFVTDGQMELIGLRPDFAWFDHYLGGLSYVLIGHRGHTPTLFPEVFDSDGNLDHAAAMQLYGSHQQIEDIERIRVDMEGKRLLPPSGKIGMFGASGAGILVQQYAAKYGHNVERLALEVTGAPDLSRDNEQLFSPPLSDVCPRASASLSESRAWDDEPKRAFAYLLYQAARKSPRPCQELSEFIQELIDEDGEPNLLLASPEQNYSLAKLLLRSPGAAASKVRMFELLGHDLTRARWQEGDAHLLYSWSEEIVGDFLQSQREGKIQTFELAIDRGTYRGEVLVLTGAEDVVFSRENSRRLRQSYSNSLMLVLDGGHSQRAEPSLQRELRREFFKVGLEGEEFSRTLSLLRSAGAVVE